ncbi:hypothetical protein CSKR_105543 [Clonorchis sinensis]|uniref:Uncharacterized protein n=1 Tax=Clonorchis sinensis TaxID=79923 RepID=A0A419QET4_CLOSI|nr:hypothetical protein CSKR_105543 [Clonorchis sinensis]
MAKPLVAEGFAVPDFRFLTQSTNNACVNSRLPKRVLSSTSNSERRKQRGGQPLTWQKGMKEITKSLGAVGATRLPGWRPHDHHCVWLKMLQDMTANRCQWRSCFQFLPKIARMSI